MATNSENKCPLCGGVLAFDPARGKVVCQYCDSVFEPGFVGLDQNGEPVFPGESETAAPPEEESVVPEFDWGDYKKHAGAMRLDGTAVYHCHSCGAVIETVATTAATRCPYCGNEVVIDDRVTGGLRPNGIIPFKVTKKELTELVRKFCRKRPLLPKGFFEACKQESVQGLYVPFWMFDCDIDGTMTLSGTKVRTWSDHKYNYTETSYYDLYRAGGMSFAAIPVDGSVKMPNDLMDSLEPYKMEEMREFDGSYLAGFLADRFDEDPDQSLPRANTRLMESAARTFTETGSGYSSVKVTHNGMQITSAAVKYVLAPVYMLHYTYRGKEYTYAVNGQTGKVAGTLPISRAKSWAWFSGVCAALAGIAYWLFV